MITKLFAIFSLCLTAALPFPAHAQNSISAVVAVDNVAIMSTDRLVITLTGRYTCGPLPQPQPTLGATFATASGQVSQADGRDIGQGGFGFIPICDASEHTFQANVQAGNIPWHGGLARARITLFVQLCDQFFNCQQATATADTQISIRG
ncbi:MAG TPA: hypothetical protein VI431_13775 [Candidatus Acidoferrum sp.]